MILSHAHKFIYIKTCRTASTSVETALSSLCGPNDVITQTSKELRTHREVHAQNTQLKHQAVPRRPLVKRLLGRPERYYHPSAGYYEHIPAWRIRTYVGDEIWRRYFKFTFERNPWDRQVSYYHLKTKSKDAAICFDRFNRNRRRAYVSNWSLYTIENNIALDFVGRYETLEQDFATVLDVIGMPETISLAKMNVSNRIRDYRSYYTNQSRAMIGDWYEPEIEHFGYTF